MLSVAVAFTAGLYQASLLGSARITYALLPALTVGAAAVVMRPSPG